MVGMHTVHIDALLAWAGEEEMVTWYGVSLSPRVHHAPSNVDRCQRERGGGRRAEGGRGEGDWHAPGIRGPDVDI